MTLTHDHDIRPRRGHGPIPEEGPPTLTWGVLDLPEIETQVRRPLGRQVAAHIHGAGFTQPQVARHLGIVLSTLEAKLTGARPFTVAELIYLSRLLDVPVSVILRFGPAAA